MQRPSVVLVVSRGDRQENLSLWLRDLASDVCVATDAASAQDACSNHRPDLVVIADTRSPAGDGVEIVRSIRRQAPSVPTILIVTHGSEDLAIEALRAGASDYLHASLSSGDLVASIRRCLGRGYPTEGTVTPDDPQAGPTMIACSRHMREAVRRAREVARSTSTVLVTGETGTGKELIAELIHRSSPRRARAFVRVNCAAIPESLFESELFGHEKGAFTGAHLGRAGSLELANGGSIFFDEIGDMSLAAQAKILRALETREVHRLGGRGSRPLDLRIVAATNQDLDRAVAEGRFRSDLYYRLDVVRIHLVPLRERREDIAALLEHYVRDLNNRFEARVEGFTDQALDCLLSYPWPGNVRELRNVLEAIVVAHPPPRISAAQLPERVRGHGAGPVETAPGEVERLLQALQATNWNKSWAAKRLHWSRVTLYRKLAKYQLTAPPLAGCKPSREPLQHRVTPADVGFGAASRGAEPRDP